jgi:hypothetical protein
MKNVFVKWCWNDSYGCAEQKVRYEWFENEEQANEWIADKIKHNGGYFRLYKVAQGDYNEFQKIEILEQQLKELKEKF